MKKIKPYFPKHTLKKGKGTNGIEFYWLMRDEQNCICPFQTDNERYSHCGSWCALFYYFTGKINPKDRQHRLLLHCGDYSADYDISEVK